MKKILYLFILLLLLTGCTANYTLEIENDTFKENISSSFSLNSLDEGVRATLPLPDDYKYNAFVNRDNMFLDIVFDSDYDNDLANFNEKYIYNANNFENASSINDCFEEHTFYNEENFYYIKLGGSFNCRYEADVINITIKTDNKVLSTNAKKKGNEYSWKLTEDNFDNTDIYIEISKKSENSSNNFFTTFRIVGFIVLIVLSGVTYFLYRSKNSGKV